MTGIIILAAGASTRLGQPKQNLRYNGQSLLQHALNTATSMAACPVALVLGAYEADILPLLDRGDALVVYNAQWAEGMAASIRTGLQALLDAHPRLEAVMILLCDQPFVDVSLLSKLLREKQLTGKGIVACAYQQTLGAPVLFDQTYFDALLALRGTEGAKKLLYQFEGDVALLDFPAGIIDIDTMADYEQLTGEHLQGEN